jgi:cadmium resistance protein CadD (predicted permease)
MDSPLALLGLAAVVFAATDVDDLFLLVAFFADRRFRARDVVIGQFLGIGALYGASVAASAASLVAPLEYIGLLGLVPIAMGARQLLRLGRGESLDGDERPPESVGRWKVLSVAAVTIANGGDNVAVYTPLLAARTGAEIAAFGLVFAVLTALWCVAARWIVTHPALRASIERHGHRVVPIVLIALGVLILAEAGSYRLLGL